MQFMKKWAALAGLFVVLAAGGLYFRGTLQKDAAEDNEVPQVPKDDPTKVKPAGKPGPKADVSKIYAWVNTHWWTNGGPEGVNLVGSYFLHNEGKVPVHNLVAELSLTFPDDPGHNKKFIIPLRSMQTAMAIADKGVLMPDQTTTVLSFNFRVGPELWRPSRTVSIRIIDGQVFDDRSNLKEPMQLAAFIRESTPEKIVAAFKADPELKKVELGGLGPMQFALLQHDVAKVKAVESLGFDIGKPVRWDESAYHFAVFGGPAIIDYLGSKGVKGPTKSKGGYSAAHYAVYQWDPKVYAALKRAGQPIDAKDNDGATPLHTAVQMKDPDLTKALLALNVPVDVDDKENKSPLVVAMGGDNWQIFEMLSKKSNIRRVSPNGNTLLHWAVFEYKTNYVQWLIEEGFDKNAKNKAGETPKDIAKKIFNERDREQMMSFIEYSQPKKKKK